MKIEMIKEVGIMGKVTYFIEIDGSYLAGSNSSSLEQVEKCIEDIKANKGKAVRTVLKTETIIK